MANLALDLLISASDLELGGPSTPTKIELKIGLSRGPVIGGYVYTGGLKRFRVVGETITKSTNLATSCYPNSIHLCVAVKQYLKQTGIYDIRKEIRPLVTDDDSAEKLEQCFWLFGRKVSCDVFHKTNYEAGSSLHLPKTPEYTFDINDCYTNRHRYKFL
ncbi:hypothetical protein LOTGIDRAFT_153715 [Lottia gigantea]|uniref:Guanylate cyclase domain-containing protein n=1 Tax=Lottia gigantea TaxID=225164 RepID=V4A8B1_LOTGI|nr:hypothetical protein LOTGIDRAFT_153715 [Lottia gigantea]ESO91285.1 hypothetical protein LOTGIDRAFT_153715 [Lottia gigantea]